MAFLLLGLANNALYFEISSKQRALLAKPSNRNALYFEISSKLHAKWLKKNKHMLRAKRAKKLLEIVSLREGARNIVTKIKEAQP